jgi:hypothetical protein
MVRSSVGNPVILLRALGDLAVDSCTGVDLHCALQRDIGPMIKEEVVP